MGHINHKKAFLGSHVAIGTFRNVTYLGLDIDRDVGGSHSGNSRSKRRSSSISGSSSEHVMVPLLESKLTKRGTMSRIIYRMGGRGMKRGREQVKWEEEREEGGRVGGERGRRRGVGIEWVRPVPVGGGRGMPFINRINGPLRCTAVQSSVERCGAVGGARAGGGWIAESLAP